MAHIYKSGAGWRVQLQVNGQRLSKTLPTKRDAQRWAMEQEATGARLKTGWRTFKDAATKYELEVVPKKRGAKWERARLSVMVDHFGPMPMGEIDAPDIARWRDLRLKTVSGSTVVRESNLLKHLFHTARDEWRWIDHDPFRGVKLPKESDPRHQRWRWQQIKRVLRYLGYTGRKPETKSQEVALAFMIALRTGMRAGEVLQVGPQTLSGRVVTLAQTKTEKRAQVPLTKRGAALCGLVDQWTIDGPMLDALFRKARDACMVRDLRFHDARSSALTWLSRKVDVLTLARISRHKDLKILLNTYYRETAEEIAGRLK
jgi:integrase